jgi:dolichol-phosphate mannosyltransferase
MKLMASNTYSKKCILVMPTYNEEACIKDVVTLWQKELSRILGNNFSILVVNDGSKDRTGLILENLKHNLSHVLVEHQDNGGHGNALLNGYKKALELKPEYVFQTDSDNQFSPSDFEKLWALRENSQMILGFRSTRHDPLHRLIITRILRALLFTIFGVWIKDSNIPFRLFRASYLKRLLALLPNSIFAPNIFLSVLAKRDGTDLKNITVTHLDRQTGQVSIVRLKLLKVCLKSAGELFSFRFALSKKLKTLKSNS